MALNDGSGPEGHVYTTYSDISDIKFGIVIAAAFDSTYSYSLSTEHSGFGKSVSLNNLSEVTCRCHRYAQYMDNNSCSISSKKTLLTQIMLQIMIDTDKSSINH